MEYQVNKDYIAKNLCVNRSRPMSCCQGKCYLDKKLAKDESPQQSPGKAGQKEESPLQLFAQNGMHSEWMAPVIIPSHSTRYLPARSQEFILSFFQPPQA